MLPLKTFGIPMKSHFSPDNGLSLTLQQSFEFNFSITGKLTLFWYSSPTAATFFYHLFFTSSLPTTLHACEDFYLYDSKILSTSSITLSICFVTHCSVTVFTNCLRNFLFCKLWINWSAWILFFHEFNMVAWWTSLLTSVSLSSKISFFFLFMHNCVEWLESIFLVTFASRSWETSLALWW